MTNELLALTATNLTLLILAFGAVWLLRAGARRERSRAERARNTSPEHLEVRRQPTSRAPVSTGEPPRTVSIDDQRGTAPPPLPADERSGPPPGAMDLRGRHTPPAQRPVVTAALTDEHCIVQIDGSGVTDLIRGTTAELDPMNLFLRIQPGTEPHGSPPSSTSFGTDWVANIVNSRSQAVGRIGAQRTATGWSVSFWLASQTGGLREIILRGAQRAGFAASFSDDTVWVGHRPGGAIRLSSLAGPDGSQPSNTTATRGKYG